MLIIQVSQYTVEIDGERIRLIISHNIEEGLDSFENEITKKQRVPWPQLRTTGRKSSCLHAVHVTSATDIFCCPCCSIFGNVSSTGVPITLVDASELCSKQMVLGREEELPGRSYLVCDPHASATN